MDSRRTVKGAANANYLLPAWPVIAFWLQDAWYPSQERTFLCLYDNVCPSGA